MLPRRLTLALPADDLPQQIERPGHIRRQPQRPRLRQAPLDQGRGFGILAQVEGECALARLEAEGEGG